MATFGFIGMGNMGYAMLTGAIKKFDKKDFIYTDVNVERLKDVKAKTEVNYVVNAKECIQNCKFIILAVKPQYYGEVYPEIKAYASKEQIIVSLAPGVSIQSIKEATKQELKVIRTMPNTPALIGEGMAAASYSADKYSEEEKECFEGFMNSFGSVEIIEESLMNASVAVNGSSPAFVYMMIEAMADGGVKYGLPREKALHLAAQTVLGSAKMVLETGKHPAVLKDMVCSPGGTTIQGVSALEEQGFRSSILKAMDAVYVKSTKLG